MKKIRSSKWLVTALLAVATAAAAQTTNEECAAVLRAAQAGRENANQRLAQVETSVKEAVSRTRSCMERFGDGMARQTISLGGVDLAPLRDGLFNAACNVIEGQLTASQQQLAGEIARQQGAIAARLADANRAISGAVAMAQLANPGVVIKAPELPKADGFFDKLACKIGGSC